MATLKMSYFTVVVLVLFTLAVVTCNSISLVEKTVENDAVTISSLENERNDTRIIGGGPVLFGQALFISSLRSLSNHHFCGAAIVSNRFVLTSALCTAGRAANSINVVVGTHILSSTGGTHRSNAIIIHPGFDPITLINDISLVSTATAIVLTNFVQTIPISPSVDINFDTVSVFGWGLYSRSGVEPINHLQYLQTTPMSNKDCADQQNSELNAARISDNKVCTSSSEGHGTCFGDQGGPLVAMIRENQFTPPVPHLIGISSWQSSCAGGYPDVYERVAPYFLWIRSYIL